MTFLDGLLEGNGKEQEVLNAVCQIVVDNMKPLIDKTPEFPNAMLSRARLELRTMHDEKFPTCSGKCPAEKCIAELTQLIGDGPTEPKKD